MTDFQTEAAASHSIASITITDQDGRLCDDWGVDDDTDFTPRTQSSHRTTTTKPCALETTFEEAEEDWDAEISQIADEESSFPDEKSTTATPHASLSTSPDSISSPGSVPSPITSIQSPNPPPSSSSSSSSHPDRFSRCRSIDRGAKQLGLNVSYMERLSLPLLRSEVRNFFQQMASRCQRALDRFRHEPTVAYQTLKDGLTRNMAAAAGESERETLERALKKINEELSILESSSSSSAAAAAAAAGAAPPACVSDRINRLTQHVTLLERMKRGFDENSDARDRLLALPTTKSNAEGNRCLMDIMLALDALCLSEGLNKLASTKVVLSFQRLSATFLEQHELEDPRWKAQ